MTYTALVALQSPVSDESTTSVVFALFSPGCSAAFDFSRPTGSCDPRPHCTVAFDLCITHGHMTPAVCQRSAYTALAFRQPSLSLDPMALLGLAACQRSASMAPALPSLKFRPTLDTLDTRFWLNLDLYGPRCNVASSIFVDPTGLVAFNLYGSGFSGTLASAGSPVYVTPAMRSSIHRSLRLWHNPWPCGPHCLS